MGKDSETIEVIAKNAKNAAGAVAGSSTHTRNKALLRMAELLHEQGDRILTANRKDLDAAEKQGLARNMIDRLVFNRKKIQSRISSLNKIASLSDPVGEIYEPVKTLNGMMAARMRVPLGVIMMIYEARPHVTINAGAFCLKSGNAAILRGGSEAKECNTVLGEMWSKAVSDSGLPAESVQVIYGSHEEIHGLLKLDDYIDLVIPRGGKKLIQTVSESSKIPVIKHFEGICHVYLDQGCDLGRGIDVALDSKCLMPEVCNAMETLLVHESLEPELARIVGAFQHCGVKVKGCERTRKAVPGVLEATEEDWRTEYLDMIVSVRVVEGVDQAAEHINTFGSHHTDSIVTDSEGRGRAFVSKVDSGVVLVNASTMFCDGESLGMGAEIGISTDKIHARGPMGLRELMSYKFVILGEGHVMGDPASFKK